jgi:hypothetical protein
MSSTALLCSEVPLAWPASAKLTDLNLCRTCGVRISAPYPGTLQITSRRPVGDGVNIEESNHLGIDYRGQRYTYDGAIFNTPGLHIFPDRKEVYPAEYHVYFKTLAAPFRTVTLIVPVTHLKQGPGADYFAAMAAQPDPSLKRPTLATLFVPGTPMLQYRSPALRGRTAATPSPAAVCDGDDDHHNLLVLRPAHIRAADLERIPREGSASTDPRDLPAPGIKQMTAVTRDRLVATAVYANPGIEGGTGVETYDTPTPDASGTEMECAPLQVVDGRDVIQDASGKWIDLRTLLGVGPNGTGTGNGAGATEIRWGVAAAFVAILVGLFFADYLVTTFLWPLFFKPSVRLEQWEKAKIWLFLVYAVTVASARDAIVPWFLGQ